MSCLLFCLRFLKAKIKGGFGIQVLYLGNDPREQEENEQTIKLAFVISHLSFMEEDLPRSFSKLAQETIHLEERETLISISWEQFHSC